MPRLFVALEVPSTGLLPLGAFPAGQPPHLTLSFLGEVPSSEVSAVSSALDVASTEVAPFQFELGGIGAFPSRGRPRIVWVGFSRGSDELTDLAGRIARALGPERNRSGGRPFTPHITLLRVRRPEDAGRAQELLARPAMERYGESSATEFLLKQSDLRPEGAVHSVLERYPLSGTSHRTREP